MTTDQPRANPSLPAHGATPSRRGVLKLGLAAVAGLGAPALAANQEVGAAWGWSRGDAAVVEIGGKRARIAIVVAVKIGSGSFRQFQVKVAVPIGVDAALVATEGDAGAWPIAFAESANLRVTERGIQFRVAVTLRGHGDAVVSLEVTDDQGQPIDDAHGTVNERIVAKGVL